MLDSTTGSGDEQAEIPVESVTTGELPDRRPRVGGLAACDRLRRIALETRVAALEAELGRERRRH